MLQYCLQVHKKMWIICAEIAIKSTFGTLVINTAIDKDFYLNLK